VLFTSLVARISEEIKSPRAPKIVPEINARIATSLEKLKFMYVFFNIYEIYNISKAIKSIKA